MNLDDFLNKMFAAPKMSDEKILEGSSYVHEANTIVENFLIAHKDQDLEELVHIAKAIEGASKNWQIAFRKFLEMKDFNIDMPNDVVIAAIKACFIKAINKAKDELLEENNDG